MHSLHVMVRLLYSNLNLNPICRLWHYIVFMQSLRIYWKLLIFGLDLIYRFYFNSSHLLFEMYTASLYIYFVIYMASVLEIMNTSFPSSLLLLKIHYRKNEDEGILIVATERGCLTAMVSRWSRLFNISESENIQK